MGGGEMTDLGPALVPSMVEIAAVPKNGLRVVSTFSGCGGSCLGFRMAGYTTIFASEFIPAAQETYRANHPGVYMDTRDIRQLTAQDIFEATGTQRGEVDVLEGSPPCASFSMAGKRDASWGDIKPYSDTKQRVDDLFFEFSRIVDDLQPKVFVAENVKGLTIGKARGYLKEILLSLRGCGYKVKCAVLDAQYFGVPQHRERLIFIGVRDDLGKEPTFPKPAQRPVPLKAALPHIVRFRVGGGPNKWKLSINPMDTVVQSGAELSETAYLSANGFCETDIFEKRKFTIPELKRICGFPDDFILTGTFAQQWERLGRAVAPPMMAAVAAHIRDTILTTGNVATLETTGEAFPVSE